MYFTSAQNNTISIQIQNATWLNPSVFSSQYLNFFLDTFKIQGLDASSVINALNNSQTTQIVLKASNGFSPILITGFTGKKV